MITGNALDADEIPQVLAEGYAASIMRRYTAEIDALVLVRITRRYPIRRWKYRVINLYFTNEHITLMRWTRYANVEYGEPDLFRILNDYVDGELMFSWEKRLRSWFGNPCPVMPWQESSIIGMEKCGR